MDDGTGGNANDVSAIDRYRSGLSDCEQTIQGLTQRDALYAKVRLFLFLCSGVACAVAFFSSSGATAWVVGGLFFAAFFLAAVLNEPIQERLVETREDADVYRRLIARLQRDWDSLDWSTTRRQLSHVELKPHQREVADDLDLFGKASLFQLISMARTDMGVSTLAHWITGPAEGRTAKARSEVIERLAPRDVQRHRFYALAARVGGSTGNPEAFLKWVQSESWLSRHRWLAVWSNLSAVTAVISLIVLFAALIELAPAALVRVSTIVLGGLAVLNLAISSIMLGPVHQIFSVAMSGKQSVDQYRELFRAARWLGDSEPTDSEHRDSVDRDSQSDRLDEIRKDLMDETAWSAESGMLALRRIAMMGGLRQSAATFLIYLVLQLYGLWDVRVLARLERWQQKYREAAPRWFASLGELEALMTLAAVRFDNPNWVYPQWRASDEPIVFESEELGHPLLSDQQRVCNDVTIGPPGTALLVTGSNMSGKSTMLRSVGLNIALAATGAPVCARRLSLPSVELATSIRVRDNLAEGVSFYMAELKRLQRVAQHAREFRRRQDCSSLFLLDEILQGTNSRERQIAVSRVLRHLIDCSAIGAISTHDLELADDPQLTEITHTVHFRETIRRNASGQEEMSFDYQMRSGVSPTTNALRLLEIVGLTDLEDSPSGDDA